ncbi:MAG: phosphonate C-P lyase system protein PhnH [Alphaproteobacteria bacterium]|nr:phosphonate C-P lyase system protein PhnH [Alphaproteobacteria bacterium]
MAAMTDIKPGFHDPVLDSQAVFRAVLDAMARPGRLHRVSHLKDVPAPLAPATAAVCLALVDQDTPLWLAPDMRSQGAETFLRFHCGCPLVDDRSTAAFAIVSGGKLPGLDGFAIGDDAYPETSTTVIVQTEGLATGEGLVLRGPGIEATHRLAVLGLRSGVWREWADNGPLFPCGVDLILVDDQTLAALPRTTTVTEQEA